MSSTSTADEVHANRRQTGARAPASRGFVLRRRSWPCGLAAALFVAACGAAAAVAAVHGRPRADLWVYSVNLVPPFLWFAALLPPLIVGSLGLRWPWALLGFLTALFALACSEDLVQTVRPYPGRHRREFSALRERFLEESPIVSEASSTVDVPLRIVTANLALGRQGAEYALGQIVSHNPDIVFLQECPRGGGWKALEEQATSAQMHHAPYGARALLSRYPIRRLPGGPLPTYRGVVWAVEARPGVELACINVHLRRQLLRQDWLYSRDWDSLTEAIEYSRGRLGSVRQAAMHFGTERPVIVAGDFNLPAGYADVRWAMSGLKDCFAENGYGWGKTVPSRLPVYRIDAVFAPRNARVYYCASLPTRFSDHRMVVTEISVPVATSTDASAHAMGAADSRPAPEA